MNIKILKKIINLEEVNSSLIKQLNDYDEEAKKNRKAFEEKINQEVSELEANLKILKLN
jgi:biopolymer transport protein ExbB/TolQ